MRYRELQNSLSSGTYTVSSEYFGYPPSYVDTSYEQEYTALQTYIAMLDVNTPRWRELIAHGHILNNPMLSVAHTVSQTPFLFMHIGHDKNQPGWTYVSTGGYTIPSENMPMSLDWDYYDGLLHDYQGERDIALAKAWANVNISEIQALASLGELPETVHWMKSLVLRMISILRSFTQKRLLINASKMLRSGKSVIDAMSEMWLEFRYAIRPLIFEMDQARKAWNHILDKALRQTARGFSRISPSIDTSTYGVAIGAASGIVSRVHTVEANFRAGVLFSVDTDIGKIQSVWGIDHPIEAIWELVPFSFIVDWFFNVGNVLASFTPNPGLHPLASWITEEVKESWTDSLSGGVERPDTVNLAFDRPSTVLQSGCTTTTVLIRRRLPSPSRSIVPSFSLKLDTAKLIDLATIGRNLFSVFTRRS